MALVWAVVLRGEKEREREREREREEEEGYSGLSISSVEPYIILMCPSLCFMQNIYVLLPTHLSHPSNADENSEIIPYECRVTSY